MYGYGFKRKAGPVGETRVWLRRDGGEQRGVSGGRSGFAEGKCDRAEESTVAVHGTRSVQLGQVMSRHAPGFMPLLPELPRTFRVDPDRSRRTTRSSSYPPQRPLPPLPLAPFIFTYIYFFPSFSYFFIGLCLFFSPRVPSRIRAAAAASEGRERGRNS